MGAVLGDFNVARADVVVRGLGTAEPNLRKGGELRELDLDPSARGLAFLNRQREFG